MICKLTTVGVLLSSVAWNLTVHVCIRLTLQVHPPLTEVIGPMHLQQKEPHSDVASSSEGT